MLATIRFGKRRTGITENNSKIIKIGSLIILCVMGFGKEVGPRTSINSLFLGHDLGSRLLGTRPEFLGIRGKSIKEGASSLFLRPRFCRADLG